MFTRHFIALPVLFCSLTLTLADPLESGFQNPPNSAKPQTWWHWMNGNITKEGITADLEAMKQIGLDGATIVNVGSGIPPGPVSFMSPEWQDDFKFAVHEANRLGLELGVENCAGWSNSGGPWITTTNAMKYVTTSELPISGPASFDDALPQPPTKLGFYRDIAVLAFPAIAKRASLGHPLDAKEGRSGRAVLSSTNADNSPAGSIPERKIIDLTSKLDADGKLHWQVPAGQWVIARIGYTPTGVNNHPAPEGGMGLECDKLNPAGMDANWAGFMQKALDYAGPLAGTTLNLSLIDSYEVGGQNWSENFRDEFQKRRGYDPIKYMPVFAGYVVGSPAVSERFLWDVRRTIADLFAENYYGRFAELCRQHGLQAAIEPYTGPFESLQSGGPDNPVMGEFWAGTQGDPSVRVASSVAHIYGKTIVGTETFTGNASHGGWEDDPDTLKALGDLMFCQGVNRYTFHRYAMQPWTNRWPGMTMGPWGINFERTETWWDEGKPWIEYITRCQFLLQQGRPIQDAAYFDGQSAPVERRDGDPAMPSGYDFDDVNADVLMHGATVQDGRLTLASGANYAALILPPSDINMTPQMMECLRKLVRDGATVIGPRPQHSPSLGDYPKCDKVVKKIAKKLWGDCNGTDIQEHTYGKGRVIWGKSLADVFTEQNLKPDFDYQSDDGVKLVYTHRTSAAADIYFVSNQRTQFCSAECTFRVGGKIPELWHPDTGVIEPAPIWSASDGRTTVRLDFEPIGSVFVIFRQMANGADHIVAADGGTRPGSAGTPQLKIQHAVYTATDGAGEVDETVKLSELAQHGPLVVGADNENLGGDPAQFHPKELRVDYTLDGQPGHAVVPEGGTLRLPADPFTGSVPAWSVSLADDGSPVIKTLENGGVTLRTADGKVLSADAADVPAPLDITGPWNLSFPPNWGAPPSITLDHLISWPDSTNDGVRYFSGTAVYEKDIDIPADRLAAGRELWLDLGAVKNFAGVSLNGRDYGVLWKTPFRVNVTDAAKPGVNQLVVKVTNLWPNRLIGDEQLPPDCQWNRGAIKKLPQWVLDGKPSPTGRYTFTTWQHYTKNSPLLESGLLGPVQLETVAIIPARAVSGQ